MNKLPPHLAPYAAEQHYERYTPIDHAVWRYVMRQNHHALRDKAHAAFVNGLAQSGIETERIPRVSDMNACLAKIGWGAVIVNGLIPGAVFYELLANGILPIAAEIRKLTNIEYTPAPDIVHEAAGHAPILFDPEYRAYVQHIGAIGTKAFSVKARGEAFEALRQLTIVMEDPRSTAEEKAAARKAAEEKQKAAAGLTEAEQVSRLFWTTVEYGLIGDMAEPKIYGAGLLSSVGESKHCYTDAVEKLPYSVAACTEHPKRVTEMQTRLYVCRSFEQLMEGAEELANTMAFRAGGTASLEKALHSGTVSAFAFNSGLGVTGIVGALVKDKDGEAIYVNTTGETALTVGNEPLRGHGKETHAKGYGTPIGLLQGNIALEACDDQALEELGLTPGSLANLVFASGIRVSGLLKTIIRNDGQVVLLSFADCTVTLGERELFKKEWGLYDMAAGSRIVSAYPGAAHPASYFGASRQAAPPPAPAAQEPQSAALTELEQLYRNAAMLRERGAADSESFQAMVCIHDALRQSYPDDWLLRLELLELTAAKPEWQPFASALRAELHALSGTASMSNLIKNGLAII